MKLINIDVMMTVHYCCVLIVLIYVGCVALLETGPWEAS